jgi:hypothetical protein
MPQEASLYGLWIGKQTAKGTENTTPSKRLVQVGGDFNIARDDGEEAWSDLTKYGGRTDWINTLVGNGNPAVEATPSELAYLLWLMHGGETVVAGTNERQTLTSTATGGSITLTYTDATGSQTTTAIQFNDSAATIDTRLEALTKIGAGQVTVGGGPLNTTPVTIDFTGTLAAQPIRALTVDNTLATGGTASIAETTPGVRNKHTFVPSLTAGHYCTFARRVGLTVLQRQSFIDCLITSMVIESSTANKATRATPTVLSLDPGKVLAADPAAAIPSTKPFIYTEGTGAFVIDTFAQSGQSQFTFTANEDRSPVYGDDAVPVDLATGQPSVTIGATLVMVQAALDEYNRLVYGLAAPSTGTKPLRNLPALGSYSADLKQKDNDGFLNGYELKLTVPGVKWAVPDAPNPNPAGGNTEIALAGSMRPVSGSQPYTIEIWNADAAYTV